MKLGQIVFLLSKTNNKVIPAKIIEETIKRTLNGDTIVYAMHDGDSKFEFVQEEFFVFNTIHDLRQHLIDKMTIVIDQLMNKTLEKASVQLKYEHNKQEAVVKAVDKRIA